MLPLEPTAHPAVRCADLLLEHRHTLARNSGTSTHHVAYVLTLTSDRNLIKVLFINIS